MERDIRTKHGKLIGKLDELTGIFSIKNGNKITSIEVPPSGLNLSYTVCKGITEEVHIKLENNISQVA